MDNNISIFDFAGNQTPTTYLQVGNNAIELLRPSTELLVDTIQWVLDAIITEQPFINGPIKRIFIDFGLVAAFTSITVDFTEKSVSEIYAAYDALLSYDIFDEIRLKADKALVKFYLNGVEETLSSIITYKASAVGILDTITAQAQGDTAIFEEAEKIMTDPNQIQNVKNLLDTYNKMSAPPEK